MIEEYNDESALYSSASDQMLGLEPSPVAKYFNEYRLVSQDGTVEEVELDLRQLKAMKSKRRNSKLTNLSPSKASPYK